MRKRISAQMMRGLIAAICGCLLLGLWACSTNKNTAASRNWQAFTTRYNVYYNGSEHYNEQLKNMEKSYQDDYTRRVPMHPAEARSDNKLPQPTGDFKRTIEKMQKAIQLHSITKKPKKRTSTPKDKAFRSREEFNPFLHNAWLMMGRAQYFNGDFLGAASTFFYISRHFKWLPNVVDEAKLWQARSYLAMNWLYEAENILTHIHRDKLNTKELQQLYDFDMADYYVQSSKGEEAIPFLTRAAQAASGSQKNRLFFLLGQVQRDLGNKQQAYQAFSKAGSGASTDYRTKFNARIAQSEVFVGSNIKGEVRALKSMARYQRNHEYLDQIYYAIGNLYLSRKDTTEAEKSYAEAIEKSVNGGINKALPQLALGAIYFSKHDYVKAQPLYSEAVPALSDTYPGYKEIKKRSDVLDELATYSGNVQLQDSLLTLSELSEEEQMKVCQRLADEYIKKQKEAEEEARRQEALAQANALGNEAAAGKDNTTQFTMNNDKSWYFYNTQAKNAGKTEFQRRWGSRKNEDDWRRRNKNTFSFEDNADDDDIPEGSEAAPNDSITPEEQQKLDAQNDPTKPEYYLKDIPKTEQEKITANDIIQEGLYNIGLILKDKLEDFAEARRTFEELDTRYPDNIYRLDAYYNMYLMDVRQDRTAQAEVYRQKIITDFPDSPYGQAMKDPNYFDNLRRMDKVQEQMYETAYQAYLNNENERVHTLTAEMERDYPLSKVLPKFVFIDALSYVTDKDNEKFKERLTELLQKWPDTDMTSMASDMLGYLKAGRTLNSGGGNTRGMLWETRLTTDSVAGTLPDGTPANFDLDPNKPQLLVLAFPLDSVSPNQLLFDVARHNFSTFTVKDFDLEQMNFGNVGLLIIKGFANMKELEHYRSVLARDDNFSLPSSVRPIMISVANFDLLLREGRSFEEYFRYEEEATMREKEKLENPEPEDIPADDEELDPGEMTTKPDTEAEEEPTEESAEVPETESEEEPKPTPAAQ
ncbi:MAG: tetratricopeptide repeat protein [Muribaculaceae bacterium]|nr:tetratricopeptide repeat protein [Muribaculaceae bacterium]